MCLPAPSLHIMQDITRCPICKCPVRIMRREDGSADHYQFINEYERHVIPNPIPPVLADYLRVKRKGKKTVALVGAGWSSGPWAPFGEEEVWSMNDQHGLPWCKVDGVARWFQIHTKDYIKDISNFEHNHWEWLQKKHPFPIYTHQIFDDIPSSVKYPLREIQKELIGNIYRGEEKMENLFSSTINYMVALALYEDFDRIEFFGISLLSGGEYVWQREAMAYWTSKAETMGLDVWMPESCALMAMPLYGYEEVRSGNSGTIVWSKEQERALDE